MEAAREEAAREEGERARRLAAAAARPLYNDAAMRSSTANVAVRRNPRPSAAGVPAPTAGVPAPTAEAPAVMIKVEQRAEVIMEALSAPSASPPQEAMTQETNTVPLPQDAPPACPPAPEDAAVDENMPAAAAEPLAEPKKRRKLLNNKKACRDMDQLAAE